MEINVYDMLVFEDEDGNIYQDCVCSIDRDIDCVECNDIRVFFNYLDIEYIDNRYDKKLSLKEIWRRVDEDTYKKVWRN